MLITLFTTGVLLSAEPDQIDDEEGAIGRVNRQRLLRSRTRDNIYGISGGYRTAQRHRLHQISSIGLCKLRN